MSGRTKWGMRMLAIALLMVLVMTMAGCGAVDTLTSLKEKFSQEEPEVVVDTPPEVETGVPVEPETEFQGETTTVTLWFSGPQGQYLVKEERVIPKVEGIARATINELIQGPHPESNLLPTIPLGTILRDINIKEDGLCIVDFSSELIDNHLGGSAAEQLTVHSIVNTLTQFPTVDRVQFLVEGQYVDTIAGHVDISQAMARNEDIIKD